jgi:hypothetical protein
VISFCLCQIKHEPSFVQKCSTSRTILFLGEDPLKLSKVVIGTPWKLPKNFVKEWLVHHAYCDHQPKLNLIQNVHILETTIFYWFSKCVASSSRLIEKKSFLFVSRICDRYKTWMKFIHTIREWNLVFQNITNSNNRLWHAIHILCSTILP